MRIVATPLVLAALVLVGDARPASRSYSVAATFGAGRETRSFRLDKPDGVILLYRLSAPAGADVRTSVQLPGVTVPLLIFTGRTAPRGACRRSGARVVCTVGEEWCPVPAGTWRVRIQKRAGPAGPVKLTFRVGAPPPGRA